MIRFTIVIVVYLFLICIAATPVTGEGIGAIGDSLTDEYLGSGAITETDLPALSWVQLLVQLRSIDFGPLEMNPSVRGEPRSKGYEYNFARAGAAAASTPFFMPAGSDIISQANGLAPHVTSGDVDIVFTGVGHNDYFYRDYLGGSLQSGTRPDLFVLDNPDYLAFEDSVFTAIFAAIDIILDARPADPAKIIVSPLPPSTLEGVDYLVPAMAQLNTRLDTEIADRVIAGQDISVVDMYDWGAARYDADSNILIGPYIIPSDSKAQLSQTISTGTSGAGPCDSVGRCSTIAYSLNLVCHDTPGGHPGTVMQGLIANEVLEVLNTLLFTPVALLSDDEIIEAAAPGCSTPDIDTDDDGTPDCTDYCPDDPEKTRPGACGCGFTEASCAVEKDKDDDDDDSDGGGGGGGCFIKALTIFH